MMRILEVAFGVIVVLAVLNGLLAYSLACFLLIRGSV